MKVLSAVWSLNGLTIGPVKSCSLHGIGHDKSTDKLLLELLTSMTFMVLYLNDFCDIAVVIILTLKEKNLIWLINVYAW